MRKSKKYLSYEEERELLKTAQNSTGQDKRNAIRLLIHNNEKLVKFLAGRYILFGSDVDYSDLVSEGYLALLEAIKKFDINKKNQFDTYAGFWIKQYFQTLINKSGVINQSQASSAKNKKNSLLYYDDDFYQGSSSDNKASSLVETLDDSEETKAESEDIRYKDTIIQINNLINSLRDYEKILLIRLENKIVPRNLLDIYFMVSDEEKKKMVGDSNSKLLQKRSLEAEKNKNLPIVKKCLSMFTKKYKFSEMAREFFNNKPEKLLRKMEQISFNELQKLAQKKNLKFLATKSFDLNPQEKER